MTRLPDSETDELVSALRSDWGLSHLLQALALGEGFQFHILVSETPRMAQAAFRLLEEAGGHQLRVLSPERMVRETSSEPLRFEELVPILEGLATALRDSGSESCVVVIDASAATPKDEAAWRELFRRLNERRNTLTRGLNGPLVLCVPPHLEIAFAHEAPDFWSIRSTSVTISPQTTPEARELSRESELSARGEKELWGIDERERLEAAVEAARRRVKDAPDDATALAALAIQLLRLGRFEEERGTLQRAKEAYEEALGLQRQIVAIDPENTDAIFGLAGILMHVGDTQVSRGDLSGARSSYEESLGVMRRLLERDPDRPEWLRDLSVSLNRVGDVQVSCGDLSGAQSSYEESLGVMRRLLERDPDRPEWLRDLTVSLDKVGDVQVSRGDLSRARSSYEESLGLRRRLLERDPGRPECLRDLSVSLEKIGDVQRSRGDLSRAQSSYEESLGWSRRLLERDPDRPEWLRDLTVGLERVGDVQRARGDLSGAQSSYEEALGLMRRLLEVDPSRPEWLRDLVWGLVRIGNVEERQGELEKALKAYQEAREVVHVLQARSSELPAQFQDFPAALDGWIAAAEEALRAEDPSAEAPGDAQRPGSESK